MVSKQHGTLHYNASEITAMGSGMGPGSGVVPVGGIIMWSGLALSYSDGLAFMRWRCWDTGSSK